jgi:glycosyltransferase involved in cell wall biosynthesis
MKVAVYSIAMNEGKHVQRWAESAADADYLVIADTGSSDDTVKQARNHRVETHHIWVHPWRFDDARNASLALVPKDADYCIALDLDEVLMPGWRAELEKAHELGITRPRYTGNRTCSTPRRRSTHGTGTGGSTRCMR